MFRRRPDLSWPLIALLLGVFFLSLRMPRQWERIARDSTLTLKRPSALRTTVGTGSPTSVAAESPDKAQYRAVEPAVAVGNNVNANAGDVSKASTEVAAISTPSSQPVEETPVIVEQPIGLEAAVANARAIESGPRRAMPLPQTEPEVGDSTEDKSNKVHVMRSPSDASQSGPSLTSEIAVAGDTSSDRMSDPKPEVRAPSKVHPTEAPGVEHRTIIAMAIPEPSAVIAEPAASGNPLRAETNTSSPDDGASKPMAVAFQRAHAAEPDSAAGRPVVPEPQSSAADTMRQPSSEPASVTTQVASADDRPDPEVQAAPTVELPLSKGVSAKDASTAEIESRPIKAIGRAWEEPSYLLAQLEQLQNRGEAQAWARETISQIGKLGPAIAVGRRRPPQFSGNWTIWPTGARLWRRGWTINPLPNSFAAPPGAAAARRDLEANRPDGRHGRGRRPGPGS